MGRHCQHAEEVGTLVSLLPSVVSVESILGVSFIAFSYLDSSPLSEDGSRPG
jgi:hypothetical protein